NRDLGLFFNDHTLSDALTFLYANEQPKSAASDFVERLVSLRRHMVNELGAEALENYLVTVALNAEDVLERYPDGGFEFFERLFGAICEDHRLNTVTFSEHLSGQTGLAEMPSFHPGTWINGNFNIWIGNEEDNLAWKLVKETRDFLIQIEEKGVLPAESLEAAWEHIFIAQGSDWCWWYGNEHVAGHDVEYDRLFREHLMHVYKIAGREIPTPLYEAIRRSRFDRYSAIRPLGLIQPVMDGLETNPYEWTGAAEYAPSSQTFVSIPHNRRIIKKLYLGFDRENCYLRVDFLEKPDPMFELVISIRTPAPLKLVVSPLRSLVEKYIPRQEGGMQKTVCQPNFSMGHIFEGAFALTDLNVAAGDYIGFQVSVHFFGSILETFPPTQIIQTAIPGEEG
ncbi:MAG TPA: hypothetical protein PKV71_04400, partial [Calditrichia bacterium]|nr:hypothetical protein [Calditrichia bacterium]